jgi:DNA repair protein RadC
VAVQRRITDLPDHDRPRERLLSHGCSGLSDTELLAIIVGGGVPGQNALAVGAALLSDAGSLAALGRSNPSLLCQRAGLGPARAARLIASLELGRRVAESEASSCPVIRSSADAAKLLTPRLVDLEQEHVVVLLLNRQHRPIRIETIHRGGASQATFCPSAILRPAVAALAASIVVAHNHPSGDPTPSPEDYGATRALVEAGRILDIHVLDHLVITRGGFRSLVTPERRRRTAG